jgi:hypothetical protein
MEAIVEAIRDHRERVRAHGRNRWGRWKYRASSFDLSFENGPLTRDVNLDKCKDSAGVLDAVVQNCKVRLLRDRDIRDLVDALNAILNLQGNVCSWGNNRFIDPRAVARTNGYGVRRGRSSGRRRKPRPARQG